ncbi:Dbl homology domain-containing protein [Cokeromyces recurvatus]|uniref:Dbl homology domain-containing protein n=1 Tax=Cokeromyces recurvatus TaxID=90255 RepID=UPI00221F4EBA|nr:Dbl homology domain-containing protein [Cokeromyces recurvatus]KAI7900955.1 Dbl homology domain-containing protein [Cokeromyces recurvatus]
MQSLTLNDEEKLSRNGVKPNLSVDTNFTKKKSPWSYFFSCPRDKRAESINKTASKPPIKRNSLPSPPPPSTLPHTALQHHNTAIGYMPHKSNKKPMEKTTTDNRNHKSPDSNSIQSAFKKLHFPHFHRRTKSMQSSFDSMDDIYTPSAPEPIIPTFVEWSSETPLSPPPWELTDKLKSSKRHSMVEHNMIANSDYNNDTTNHVLNQESNYHSDSECDKLNNNDLSTINSMNRTANVALVETTTSTSSFNSNATLSSPVVQRRSSCTTYDAVSVSSMDTNISSKTLVENDIISITEKHTRDMPVLKRYKHPSEKKTPLKPCQKAKVRAAHPEYLTHHHSFSFCEDHLKYLYIPNVFDPVTREPILEFATIKPRKYELYRKTSWKREAKAMMTWHHTLEEKLRKSSHVPISNFSRDLPRAKIEKYFLTRRFIIKEFFTTEVSFWNQLYYTKIVFYDAFLYAFQKENRLFKEDDIDLFANLFDLMQFSAKLINHLRHLQMGPVKEMGMNPCGNMECNNLRLGKILVDMAEDFVVFLRCALDYKGNRKCLDSRENTIGYIQFKQRLLTRKETSQFTMQDYLIIPIQRVARYGLLLTDLIKHTEPNHPDYKNLLRAHQIITSLAIAMDSVQKKKKKT